jgi:hypothetical protein
MQPSKYKTSNDQEKRDFKDQSENGPTDKSRNGASRGQTHPSEVKPRTQQNKGFFNLQKYFKCQLQFSQCSFSLVVN